MVHIRGTPENMHSLSVQYFAPTFSFNQFPTVIEWSQKEPILSLLHRNPILYCRYCIGFITSHQVKANKFHRFWSSKYVSIRVWTLNTFFGRVCECLLFWRLNTFLGWVCEWTKWGDAGSNLGSKRETDELLKVDIWFSTQSWNWRRKKKGNNFWEGSGLEKCKHTFGPSSILACLHCTYFDISLRTISLSSTVPYMREACLFKN